MTWLLNLEVNGKAEDMTAYYVLRIISTRQTPVVDMV